MKCLPSIIANLTSYQIGLWWHDLSMLYWASFLTWPEALLNKANLTKSNVWDKLSHRKFEIWNSNVSIIFKKQVGFFKKIIAIWTFYPCVEGIKKITSILELVEWNIFLKYLFLCSNTMAIIHHANMWRWLLRLKINYQWC